MKLARGKYCGVETVANGRDSILSKEARAGSALAYGYLVGT